jgi:hypothetical protein
MPAAAHIPRMGVVATPASRSGPPCGNDETSDERGGQEPRQPGRVLELVRGGVAIRSPPLRGRRAPISPAGDGSVAPIRGRRSDAAQAAAALPERRPRRLSGVGIASRGGRRPPGMASRGDHPGRYGAAIAHACVRVSDPLVFTGLWTSPHKNTKISRTGGCSASHATMGGASSGGGASSAVSSSRATVARAARAAGLNRARTPSMGVAAGRHVGATGRRVWGSVSIASSLRRLFSICNAAVIAARSPPAARSHTAPNSTSRRAAV